MCFFQLYLKRKKCTALKKREVYYPAKIYPSKKKIPKLRFYNKRYFNLKISTFFFPHMTIKSKYYLVFFKVLSNTLYNDIKENSSVLIYFIHIIKWDTHTFLVLMHTLTSLFFLLNPSSSFLDLFFLLAKMLSGPKNINGPFIFTFSSWDIGKWKKENNKCTFLHFYLW